MNEVFTTDELEIIQKALEFYEKNGIQEEFKIENLVAFAHLLLINDREEAHRQAKIAEHELTGKQVNFKERLILLRAKIITLKDKALVEEL